MTSRQLITVRLDPPSLLGLQELARRDGAPISEQIRRAVIQWLAMNGLPVIGGPSFEENLDRLMDQWDYLLDRLVLAEDDPTDQAELEIPIGLSPLIPGGRRFGDLGEREYEHLIGLARHLGRKTGPMERARKAVQRANRSGRRESR